MSKALYQGHTKTYQPVNVIYQQLLLENTHNILALQFPKQFIGVIVLLPHPVHNSLPVSSVTGQQDGTVLLCISVFRDLVYIN